MKQAAPGCKEVLHAGYWEREKKTMICAMLPHFPWIRLPVIPSGLVVAIQSLILLPRMQLYVTQGGLGALGYKPRDWAVKGTRGSPDSRGGWGPEMEGAELSLLAFTDRHSRSFWCHRLSDSLLSVQLL